MRKMKIRHTMTSEWSSFTHCQDGISKIRHMLNRCWSPMCRQFKTCEHSVTAKIQYTRQLWLTRVMTGSVKSANKTCTASVARTNLTSKICVVCKQGKPSQAIFVRILVGKASVDLFSFQQSSRVNSKTFYLLRKCLQMKRKWRNNINCFLLIRKWIC